VSNLDSKYECIGLRSLRVAQVRMTSSRVATTWIG
jgi:hypothetical protein